MRTCATSLFSPLALGALFQEDRTEVNKSLKPVKVYVSGSKPSSSNPLVRDAYGLGYYAVRKPQKWVAYYRIPDCRRTPKITERPKSCRFNPECADDPPSDDCAMTHNDTVSSYGHGRLTSLMIFDGDPGGHGVLFGAGANGKIRDGDDENYPVTVEDVIRYTTPSHIITAVSPDDGGLLGHWGAHLHEARRGEGDVALRLCHLRQGRRQCPRPTDLLPDYYLEKGDKPKGQAFMMHHHQRPHGDIKQHEVSIRHIEAFTDMCPLATKQPGKKSELSFTGSRLSSRENTDAWNHPPAMELALTAA